ncbi:hypothetical protein ACFYKT_01485 [Cytobacillus sp. FJAT-53684]|uniref:DUF3794 domain-containing protein n=1 Tax=Cytobacillus mangrovibacter TaxID=3299024 RepID=A0ABW6JW54_9BACI
MNHLDPQGSQELLCINAEKVYDWVMLQNAINQNVLAASLGLPPGFNPCDPSVTNLITRCYLVDAAGDPLPPNAEIAAVEIGEREDRQFIIHGALVTLQRVTFIKTINVVVEFSGIAGTTPFFGTSVPITIDIPESVFLCAPDGTRLIVRISNVECSNRVNCTAGVLTSVDLSLNICQSVQAVADVTLELTADFCQPRDLLAADQCGSPTIPPQCPVLFPGNDC